MKHRPKGLTYHKHKENPTSFRKGVVPWNKGTKGLCVPWNKGLSKETDARVAQYAATIKKQGIRPPRSTRPETLAKIATGKRGSKNPAKRPQVREKIRKSVLALYRDHPEVLANRKPSGLNQYSGHFSSIERLMAMELDRVCVPYLHNARVGRYFPDFLIMDRVVIECDGRYWHRDTEKDKRRDAYLHQRGYAVFHFSDDRIENDLVACVNTVIAVAPDIIAELHRGAAGFVCESLPFRKITA